MVLAALAAACAAISSSQSGLSISSDQKGFVFNGQKVFLSGANQPWIQYGADFGNNQSNGQKCALQEYIANVSAAGGNSMRMWLFIEGQSIPAWNSSGFVTGTDAAGTLIDDLKVYLEYAASKNVFINLCLWNGAVLREQNTIDIMSGTNDVDGSKMRSFLDNALIPIVKALKDQPGLGAWELMNEPEGSLIIEESSEPCFDTKTNLQNSGAGWAGHHYTMEQILKFLALQAHAIHEADPSALVTVGSWSEHSLTDAFPLYNGQGYRAYYSDECMAKGGGAAVGKSASLDFAQVHSYPNAAPGSAALNKSRAFSPFTLPASAYELDKPVVIGEFSSKSCASQGCTPGGLYEWGYEQGYAGVWDWSMVGKASDSTDDEPKCIAGIAALKGKSGVGVKIGTAPPPNTCSCSDNAPPGQYTCAQQASWGKCDVKANPWMAGFCCRSCLACKGCN